MIKRFFFLLLMVAGLTAVIQTQTGNFNRSKPVVIALPERISGLDTLTGGTMSTAAERLQTLIFNSLVRKNEKFEYVGELGDFKIESDKLSVTFTLKDNIKFHNGK